jgi:PhzF family phenazine biosynthesis protein
MIVASLIAPTMGGPIHCFIRDPAMSDLPPFWHINAFTSSADGGNPAGVVMLDQWPPDARLAEIAREVALPATAFVGPTSGDVEADFAVCWFSPEQEITLCGHASLAAGCALLEQSGDGSVALATRRSGTIVVQREGASLEVTLPAISTRPAQLEQAARLIGLGTSEAFRSELGYNLFVVASESELRSIAPDFAGLSRLADDQFIVTAQGEETDIASRVFKGGNDASEDSVTGSAHAVLAPYWATRLGRNDMTAHQASARGGDLTLRLDGDRVWVGGQCVTVKRP